MLVNLLHDLQPSKTNSRQHVSLKLARIFFFSPHETSWSFKSILNRKKPVLVAIYCRSEVNEASKGSRTEAVITELESGSERGLDLECLINSEFLHFWLSRSLRNVGGIQTQPHSCLWPLIYWFVRLDTNSVLLFLSLNMNFHQPSLSDLY